MAFRSALSRLPGLSGSFQSVCNARPMVSTTGVVLTSSGSKDVPPTDTGQVISTSCLHTVVGPKPKKNSNNKFDCSIVDKPLPINVNTAIFPVLPANDVKRIESVLSIVILGDKVSLILMRRRGSPNNVVLSIKSWAQLSYVFKPRMHFLTLLKEMDNVAKDIPESDLCVVEEYPGTVPTPYMFNFHLQMAQAKSMLLGILSSRLQPPQICSIKTIAVARLFNTYVGSEKVSGQHLVEDMLLNQRLPYIDISPEILYKYGSEDAKIKEGMSQAFLSNLAYWISTKQVKHEL